VDLQTALAFRRLLFDSGYRTFHLLLGEATSAAACGPSTPGDSSDGQISTGGLVLISFKSVFFFHEITQSPSIYFGGDSIALGLYQNPTPGGVTLDLCSGSAIQAMIAAQHGKRAYAVEINPRAARVARCNVQLNGLSDKVQVINSALEDYAAHVAEPLDLITFNPPLLPVPPGLCYPFVGDGVGDGGGDALDVSRRALHAYLPHLAPGGAIELIGCGLGVDGHPTFADDLAALAAHYGARGRTHLVGHSKLQRGDAFYQSMLLTTALNNDTTVELTAEMFDAHFEKIGMTDLWLFFFRGTREEASDAVSPVTLTHINDIANLNGLMNWFQ
jgi:hypothetical protein